MTNIFKTPEKKGRKKRLFQIGVETLQQQGWTVSREDGIGKSSVRRISKDGESKLASIRTTQNKWIAFPPKPGRKGWTTLDDVDLVVAVSVDDGEHPKEALVHLLPADDMRKRFNAAMKARVAADRVQPDKRGVWIPLYHREDENPDNVSYVGGGAGLDYPAIATVAMNGSSTNGTRVLTEPSFAYGNGRLTIAEAKRGLALTFGVPESAIKITVEA
jgi:hypothetical protein